MHSRYLLRNQRMNSLQFVVFSSLFLFLVAVVEVSAFHITRRRHHPRNLLVDPTMSPPTAPAVGNAGETPSTQQSRVYKVCRILLSKTIVVSTTRLYYRLCRGTRGLAEDGAGSRVTHLQHHLRSISSSPSARLQLTPNLPVSYMRSLKL